MEGIIKLQQIAQKQARPHSEAGLFA